MIVDTEHTDQPVTPVGLDEISAVLVEQARTDGVALTGDGGLLSGLIGRVLEGALDVEMTDRVGYQAPCC